MLDTQPMDDYFLDDLRSTSKSIRKRQGTNRNMGKGLEQAIQEGKLNAYELTERCSVSLAIREMQINQDFHTAVKNYKVGEYQVLT